MKISYSKLWNKLREMKLKKQDLRNIPISSSTLAKMSRGEYVSMQVIARICEKLNCDVGDVMEMKPTVKGV